MSSTSQKHLNFVAEPMGEKPVSDLAGVGDVLGKRLVEAGFDKVRWPANPNDFKVLLGYVNNNIKCPLLFPLICPPPIIHRMWNVFVWFFSFLSSTLQAYTVLGQYLVLKKDSELFKEWMKEVCQANSKQAADCYQCLNDWCDEFL